MKKKSLERRGEAGVLHPWGNGPMGNSFLRETKESDEECGHFNDEFRPPSLVNASKPPGGRTIAGILTVDDPFLIRMNIAEHLLHRVSHNSDKNLLLQRTVTLKFTR